ncbi:flavin reductase [Methylopila capsulata]|uniref:FMN reductase (NADH) RutF n=1 Tax=Methylopila capsulata TaxID=61654 RepID=A0A9W6IQ04_9HYPH|nr:flavin reductase [Methylopila capsulata]MBM7851024.1 flavin reductase [Methylopila capsulata]GLK54083.1 FMN reductase (NADH) RutF [Methylopila capsulata]
MTTTAEAAPVARERYRDAMATVAAAVNVVTTDGPAGRAGFTATAVCSVTDAPPTLLVCVKRDSSVGEAFRANGALCVNTLAPGHVALSNLFGGRTPAEERFAAATWSTGASGAPMLEGALASFDCLISRVVEVGTHAVLFCEVVGVRLGDTSEGLIYVGRRYDAVAAVRDR